MKKNKDNQYGYSAWSMEDIVRFGRFFLLPLAVVILIVVILVMDKKKNPGSEEAVASEESSDLALEESNSEEEQESLPIQSERMFTVNGVPEVVDLLNQYFTAKQNSDAATIYRLFGWTEQIGIDGLQRQLQYDARYTEGYRNIVCYTAPGEIDGTYLVCVSYDLKFKNSLTLAPGFQWSYVRTGADGNLYLTVEDELSEPEKAFIEEALKADEIVLLRVEIYAKLRNALENDASLAESYGILEKKGGSAGANQTEQHEANVHIDGTSAAGSEIGETSGGDTESPEASQDAGSSGEGSVEDGMIHIEGSSAEGMDNTGTGENTAGNEAVGAEMAGTETIGAETAGAEAAGAETIGAETAGAAVTGGNEPVGE